MDKKTGLFSNAVIWFGTAISVSEIEAGIGIGAASSLNSLWVPLVLGHILGGILPLEHPSGKTQWRLPQQPTANTEPSSLQYLM